MDLKSFQYTFVVVGLVLFFYVLGMVYQFYTSTTAIVPYPPWVSPCPDYWSNVGGNKCQKTPAAVNGLSSCTQIPNVSPSLQYPNAAGESTVDFTNVSNLDKCNWANSCNVYWEGISDKPCVASSFSN